MVVPRTEVYKVPPQIQALIKEGIQAAATYWNVTLDPRVSFVWKLKARRTANRCLVKSSKNTYQNHYKQLWYFCEMIGDYDSMLILLDIKPDRVPVMKLETLQAFMCWKRQPDGQPLTYEVGDGDGCPILNCFGDPVLCTGTWNAPNKVRQCKSALSALHSVRDHTGVYLDICPLCAAIAPGPERLLGCARHLNEGARLYRKGNPTTHELFKNTATRLKKDGFEWEPNGASQLLPKDVRRIRNKLLSSNNIVGLETYTMVLMGIKCFLRPDELMTIKAEHFIPQLFCQHQGRIIGMVVKVKGKADKKWVYLWIWADDENPDLCPLRHLLAYLHLSQHRGGPLFPKAAELLRPPADGVYRKPEDYDNFRVVFKKILIDCLPDRGEGLTVGLHMFRKTGYLFAIWGDAEWCPLKASARHASDENAMLYRKDADSLKEMNHIFKDPMNRVSKWKNIRCEAPTTATYMNLESTAFNKPLATVAKDFVEQSLNLPPTHPLYRDQVEVLNRAMKYVGMKTACEQKDKLFEKLPPELHGAVEALLLAHVREQASRSVGEPEPVLPIQNSVDAEAMVEDQDHGQSPSESNITEDSRPGKRRRGADGDHMVGRLEWTKKTTLEEKIQFMKRYETAIPNQLTEGARMFCSRTIVPVMGCLRHHFKGDVPEFWTIF